MTSPGRRFVPAAVCAAAATAAFAVPAAPADARHRPTYHVAPKGSDRGPGTARRPFRTLGRALAASRGGETVVVAPGRYPAFIDTRSRRRRVTVRGRGRRIPTVSGGMVAGGSRLRLQRLRFTGRLLLRSHPTNALRPANHIEVRDSELTSAVPFASACATVRDGAHHIRFAGNRFHECYLGINGPNGGPLGADGQRIRSRDITIERNWIGPVRADGLQFAHWEDVKIDGNVIREQYDPSGRAHTDGIQVTGNTRRVSITSNVISHGGQLVFTQNAFGRNYDLLLANNLIYASRNYAVKLMDTRRATVVNNTVWRTRWGAMLVRDGMTDVVLANNVLDFLGGRNATFAYRGYNLISGAAPARGISDMLGADPRFVNEPADDFRLTGASPARGSANAELAPDWMGTAGADRGCSLPFGAAAGRGGPSCGAQRADVSIPRLPGPAAAERAASAARARRASAARALRSISTR